jgi:hypothetical protein
VAFAQVEKAWGGGEIEGFFFESVEFCIHLSSTRNMSHARSLRSLEAQRPQRVFLVFNKDEGFLCDLCDSV